jgi:threonine aldolase
MTTSQFLKIRGGLLVAAVMVSCNLETAKNVMQTRHYRRMAEKIDEGLRALDQVEAERTDQPRPKQIGIEVAQ